MIEQGFNFANPSFKEMTDFFVTRVNNLELREQEKSLLIPLRKRRIRKSTIRRKEMALTQL